MWTPGYWAYGDDGYYWVPGAWVPAPYEGALWTPPYWGWSDGLYVFHTGYWGPHVGYYGGVNYGFGYMGVGFVGGLWRGHEFAYNTAVVHVNETVIHNTYIDRTVVERNTVVNDRHVAYSGGPGGIQHQPNPGERQAMHEAHVQPTSFQQQHMQTARADHSSYFKANNGHPQNVVAARPLAAEHRAAPAMNAGGRGGGNRPVQGMNTGAHPAPANHPAPPHQQQSRPAQSYQQSRPAPAERSQPQSRPAYQQPSRPAPSERPQAQSRPAQRSEPQSRQAPRPEPKKEPHR
jgi:hypothetical protein